MHYPQNSEPSIQEQIEKSVNDKDLQKTLKDYAYKLSKSEEDAQDLVQQCRAQVRNKKDTINRNYPKAFLITVIRNLFINQYRRKQNRPITHIDEYQKWNNIVRQTTHNKAESDLSINVIQTAMKSLSETIRIPLDLYSQGYSYQEIAEMTHTPIGTIKSRIHIARKELRQILIQKDPSYSPFINQKPHWIKK